jgi:hypothetical protein
MTRAQGLIALALLFAVPVGLHLADAQQPGSGAQQPTGPIIVPFGNHIIGGGGPTPVATGCGAAPGPVVAGSDFVGTVTIGGGSTTCTVTFAQPYNATPFCNFDGINTVTQPAFTVTRFALQIGTGIAQTGYVWNCWAQPGG